jgi:heme/copper-type cytochrome/quinol oxidase subunit 1
MPPQTRWFIKSAFIFLVAALAVHLLQSAGALVKLSPFINALGPVYFHMFLVGWVTQLIFGIVFWMFPKYSQEYPRASNRAEWLVFWLINIGLGLRVIAEPMNSLDPGTVWGWLLAASALLQWLAGMGFVANTWGRVKAK